MLPVEYMLGWGDCLRFKQEDFCFVWGEGESCAVVLEGAFCVVKEVYPAFVASECELEIAFDGLSGVFVNDENVLALCLHVSDAERGIRLEIGMDAAGVSDVQDNLCSVLGG